MRKRIVWSGAGLLGLLGLVSTVLVFGGRFLIAEDPLPERAQVVVALRGSATASKVRHEGAIDLLRRGVADHVMLSVGRVSYWGEWVPDMARRYIDNKYGKEVAERHVLCETNADSTAEEALALKQCLEECGWRSVVVVTSDWHTRRTRLIWRAVSESGDTPLEVAVRGVPDGDFESTGWWRNRRYAKTWVQELSKLIWSLFEGLPTDDATEVVQNPLPEE